MTALTDAAGRLAGCASGRALTSIIKAATEAGAPGHGFRTRATQDLRSREVRDRLLALDTAWTEDTVSCQDLAVLLTGAGAAAQTVRDDQYVRLVWTGPRTDEIGLSGGDTLLRVIQAAHETLILSTFNSTKDPDLVSALTNRLDAGVDVWLVGETKDDAPHDFSGDSAARLAELEEQGLHFYRWPKEQRKDWIAHLGKDLHAMLHAKVAVADATHLLVTSANLSTNGMHSNMEMGICIDGGRIPAMVDRHFRQLKEMGVLRSHL